MKIYRLCNKKEMKKILFDFSFKNVGNYFIKNSDINTHDYNIGIRYLHFFKDEKDLFYMCPSEGQCIYVLDVNEDILKKYTGYGYYEDLINYYKCYCVPEFAIDSKVLQINNVVNVYTVVKDVEIRDYLERNLQFCVKELYNYEDKKNKNDKMKLLKLNHN